MQARQKRELERQTFVERIMRGIYDEQEIEADRELQEFPIHDFF